MDPVLDTTLRAALALLFLGAALHKLRAPAEFRATLAEYQLLPRRATGAMALAIASAELATAGALVLPALRAVSPFAPFILLGSYSAAIGVNLVRGRREIDCGCSGPALRQPLSPALLIRNAALAAGALACLLPVQGRPFAWPDAVSVAGSVLVLASLYASVNRMLASAPARARLRSA
jgi:hypothetical protein